MPCWKVIVNFSRSIWTLHMLCCVRNMLRMCKAVYNSGPIGCLPCPQHWQRNRNTQWPKSRLFAIRAKFYAHSHWCLTVLAGTLAESWSLCLRSCGQVWKEAAGIKAESEKFEQLRTIFWGFGDLGKKPMGFVTTFFSNQPTTGFFGGQSHLSGAAEHLDACKPGSQMGTTPADLCWQPP